MGASDASYSCVYQQEDDNGATGVNFPCATMPYIAWLLSCEMRSPGGPSSLSMASWSSGALASVIQQ